MSRALTRVAMSKKKRQAFLQVLAETGQVTQAAQAVGYTSPNFLIQLRKEDDSFAEAWEQAVEAAKYKLEAEAIRRGVDGVQEPVYYKGRVVGHRINYSDQLLMFVLRKLDPSYRDNGGKGDMNINFGVAVLPMTAVDEGDWERRAVDMHKHQTVIEVEAKEEHNEFRNVSRGD